MFLNNINFRYKLLIIYIVCVFLPIIVLNTIFYSLISNRVKKHELESINTLIENVKSLTIENIEECIGVSNTLYSDSRINGTLDKTYINNYEYLTEYRLYMENPIRNFLTAYNQISKIEILTNNETIINGGFCKKIDDSNINEPWKTIIDKDKSNILVYAYPPDEHSETQKKWMGIIRIIRKMDFYKTYNKYLKILIVDIKIDNLNRKIKTTNPNGTIILTDSNNDIVYSNNTKFFDSHNNYYLNWKDIALSKKDIYAFANLDNLSYLKGWKIRGIFEQERIFKELKSLRNTVVIIALISLVIASITIYVISDSITRRLKKMINHITKVNNKSLSPISCPEGNDEIGVLIREFNNMIFRIKGLIEDIYISQIQKKNLEIEKKQAVLNALESQINPHFLYNTLNAIRLKSASRKERITSDMLKSLANIFRRVIAWGNDFITLKEEIEFVEQYLKIQKYRFEEKINYEINLTNIACQYKLPKMTIQPFVENACVHGIEKSECAGRVKIDVYTDNNLLFCKIEDNGIGMDKSTLKNLLNSLDMEYNNKNSIGIFNVYRRLYLHYGENFNFTIKSQSNKGTIITISIPLKLLNKINSKED